MATLAEKMKKALQGVKVVDKIDLDQIPDKTRPDTPTREEKRENREYMTHLQELRDKAHNLELVISDLQKQYDEDDVVAKAQQRKQKQLRKDYLEQRMKIREQYDNLELSNSDRQRNFHLQGIRPKPMDVVHFHVLRAEKLEPYDGVALVRDENHYYIAADLYPQSDQEDNLTTCLQENPDGTFDGIWPRDTCLKTPSKFEERIMRQLVDKYADDIEKAKAYVETAHQRDLDESVALSNEIHTLTQSLDKYADIDKQLQDKRTKLGIINIEINTLMDSHKKQPSSDAPQEQPSSDVPQQPPLVDFVDDTLTPSEQRYKHLAYIRGKRFLEDMSYPLIETQYKSWLRFRLMSNVARLFEKVTAWKPLTYVLSEEYMEELKSRAKSAYKGMLPQDVVADGEISNGILVFRHQGYEDTVIYNINNIQQLSVIVLYIREGNLMFYESFSEQAVLGRPRIDAYMCETMRASGTDSTRMFVYVRNLVVSFLAMERDMNRTMRNMVEDGKGTEEIRHVSLEQPLNTDNDEDLVIRDANWYSSISVDHLIPVQGYLSHRWCGKGKDKVLQEVWVRPHERNGYHREAGVTRQ